MIYLKLKNFIKLDFKQLVILVVFCSFLKPSSQDLYKEFLEEGLSLDEIDLINNYRAQRYSRQANDLYDKSGIKQTAECGINGYSSSRTKRDAEQGPYDWPWMATIMVKQGYLQFCGGVLLNHQYVLTAAHCFLEPGDTKTKDDIVIRLGEWDLRKTTDTKHVDVFAAELKTHEDYDTANKVNDIALIKLDRSVEYTRYIRPICLPSVTPKANETTRVAGWGAVETGGDHSSVLLDVDVPIVDYPECKEAFATGTSISEESNICAGGVEGKDSCQGDSGGPLLYQEPDGDENRWVAVGIVSWGMNCAEYQPGIYTNVKYYLSWIGKRILDASP